MYTVQQALTEEGVEAKCEDQDSNYFADKRGRRSKTLQFSGSKLEFAPDLTIENCHQKDKECCCTYRLVLSLTDLKCCLDM